MVQDARTSHVARPSQYDVEILSSDGQWMQLGRPLPARVQPRSDQTTRTNWRRMGLYLSGLLFTGLLHGMLLSTLLLGTPGRPKTKEMPVSEGAPASAQSDAMEAVSMLVLLSPGITPPGQEQDSAYAARTIIEQAARNTFLIGSVNPPSPPTLAGSDEEGDVDSPTQEAMGDGAGRAMLFGRYMGQIKARIERAWEYPVKTYLDAFECKVQIRQTPNGEVKEVTLQRCGDDLTWQLSLVQAIQQASPLSAPPDDSVFTEVVTLSFEAQKVTEAMITGTREGATSEHPLVEAIP